MAMHPAAGLRGSGIGGLIRCLAAGAVAGVVAAAGCVSAGDLLHSRTPPAHIAEVSAFAAAVVGGLLFWILSAAGRRPRLWLWVFTLAAATGITLVEALLPMAVLPLPRTFGSLNGLTEPLAQVLKALGLIHGGPLRGGPGGPPHGAFPGGGAPGSLHGGPGGHGSGHIRGRFLYTAAVMHYVVAVAASLVIPWLATLGLPPRGPRAA